MKTLLANVLGAIGALLMGDTAPAPSRGPRRPGHYPRPRDRGASRGTPIVVERTEFEKRAQERLREAKERNTTLPQHQRECVNIKKIRRWLRVEDRRNQEQAA